MSRTRWRRPDRPGAPRFDARWRGMLLLVFLAALAGCKEHPPPADLVEPERPFLSEGEFAQTPTLAARQHQVVVYDLEPSASQALIENVSRLELEAGNFRFCVEKDDPYVARLAVEDADGHSAADLDGSPECVDVRLEEGTYRLRLFHRGGSFSGAHRLAFLHRINANPALLGDGGVPRIGWWAMAPNDPTGQRRPGRIRADPPPRPIGSNPNFYQAAEPIIADFSSQQIDETALFNFTNLGGFDQDVPMIRSGPYPLDLTVFDQSSFSSTFIANTKGPGGKFQEFALQIVEVGNQKVQLQEKPTFYPYTNFFIDTDNVIKWDNKSPGLPDLTAQVLLRTSFVGDPDYSQNVPGEGEVALYENCNYTGRVTIFGRDVADLSVLASPSLPLSGYIGSVKAGHNTVAVLYAEANFGGPTVTLAETPCTNGNPTVMDALSLQRRPALPVFIASSSCEECDLSGLDLTGVSVSGADLRGANLAGATLNHTILHAAQNLAGASFDGAKISCSDFSGVDDLLVDLTQTDLLTATFNPDISSCRSNFSNTKVDVSRLNPAALRLLDLTHSTIVLGQTPPTLDLQGAAWQRATLVGGSLQGAHLDNGALNGATFQGVDLQGIFLPGAHLDGANLTGAKMANSTLVGAHFPGATLIDVTGFSTVVSVGADFTGAHFGGGGFARAVLEEVTLNGATFDGGVDLSGARFNRSSLQNVDLSGLPLYGANFTQANLQNSKLAGALLSNNPDAGILGPADFTGAHLKDVDLSSAQLQGTIFHFASFYGSFNSLGNGPPVFPCVTNTSSCPSTRTGFTCSCASAAGANMTRTDFSNAFLYGVDFSGSTTVINGVDFSNAILVGANFDQATFLVDPGQGGAQPKFPGAFLQGTNLGSAQFDDTSFLNAFLDFQAGGNQMQVVLPASYTGWTGWEAPNQPVCVQLDYTGFVTAVPFTTGNTTCPDGLQHGGGCGPTPPRPGNPFWSSAIAVGQASPPGFYVNNATYTDADQSGSCNANSANYDW